MNIMLDIINMDTGEVRGKIMSIDIDSLRTQRDEVIKAHTGRYVNHDALDGLTSVLDAILDIAEEGEVL